MDTIVNFFQQIFLAVVPFVILLGLLVFVHELGHFLVAKFFGVRVEVFSLGFGKKLFSRKYGDTTYAISLIPLGGYVKMFGDEPQAEVTEAEKKFSFTHKPLHQRFLVVLAGPAMNFFFAILVFTVMAFVGEQMLQPVLGDIDTSTAAYRFGFRSGDKIVSINNVPVKTWEQAQRAIENHAGQEVTFRVAREKTNQELQVNATPIIGRNKNVISHRTWVGEIEGLVTTSRSATVAVPSPESVAGKAGLQTGDTVISINGKPINNWRNLVQFMHEYSRSEGATMTWLVENTAKGEKPGPERKLEIPVDSMNASSREQDGEERMKSLGIISPDMFVSDVLPDSRIKSWFDFQGSDLGN